MLQAVNVLKLLPIKAASQQIMKRTFLSPAYYCNEVWDHRITTPILSKVNINDLYNEIDQRHNRTGELSAVDVDIYANKVENEMHIDELLDLMHKLRLHKETSNMLPSTGHAVVRFLLQHKKNEDLVNVIDDRLNYGIFLDYYTANILMDTFYREQDYVSGCRIASQLMLQEEHDHALSKRLGILHCYHFLQKPEGWPMPQPQEEPEEEVKVRVKYLRNAFDDGHFDLKDGMKIVGKTLVAFTKGSKDALDQSFFILGLALMGREEEAAKLLKTSMKLFEEVINLLPEDNSLVSAVKKIPLQSGNVLESLVEAVKLAERQTSENDIAEQCKVYGIWQNERMAALDRQIERVNIARRLENIAETQKELQSREEKLWFFENEEKIEVEIEDKSLRVPRRAHFKDLTSEEIKWLQDNAGKKK